MLGPRGTSTSTAARCCWRPAGIPMHASPPTAPCMALLSDDARLGVRDPYGRREPAGSRRSARRRACATGSLGQRAAGRSVLGYGAASRAVALLCGAGVDRWLLPAIADTSPAKHGLRMPGTDIPIIGPAELAAHPPHAVLLFVPDLLTEVRTSFPEVEDSGGGMGGCGGSAARECVSAPAVRPPTDTIEPPPRMVALPTEADTHDQITRGRLQARLLGRRKHEIRPTALSDAQGGASS